MQKFASRRSSSICAASTRVRGSCPQARGSQHSSTVILFSVRVPVLSEQITFTQPMVSAAIIFFTRAFSRESLITERESETATMVGRPSGTAATISTMLVTKASMTCSISSVPARA